MKSFFYSICLFLLLIAPTVSAQSSRSVLHTLKEGETLSIIAAKYHTTVGDIMRLNGMNSKSVLKWGEQIKIPPRNKKPVAKTTSSSKALPEKTGVQPSASI